MTMEEKCRRCGKTLFQKVLLDEKGHCAMSSDYKMELQHDGVDSYFHCPHCSAKNVVISYKDDTGVEALRILYAKD
jgi:transcription elongation factor Elf1